MKGLSFATPRWLVNDYTGSLRKYGFIFTPFAIGCKPQHGKITCDYECLSRHIERSENVLKKYGNFIRCLIIHTEYEAPIWADDMFVKNYVDYTRELLRKAMSKCRNLRMVEIELHPGFSSLDGGRDVGVIAKGIVNYISAIKEDLDERGITLRATIENRGSSSLRKPQAASDLNELKVFYNEINGELKKRNIEVEIGLTLDPIQLVSVLKRRGYRERNEILRRILHEVESFVCRYGSLIHSIHVHWIDEGLRPHSPPPLNEVEMVVNWYGNILRKIADNAFAYVVPEITRLGKGAHEFITRIEKMVLHIKGSQG